MKTVNLELSKQLKEAGFPQEGNSFYWITSPWNGKSEVIYYQDREQLKDDFVDKRYNLVASPTADEVLDQLKDHLDVIYYMSRNVWRIEIGMFEDGIKSFEDKVLADAAAKCWLYLESIGEITTQNGGSTK